MKKVFRGFKLIYNSFFASISGFKSSIKAPASAMSLLLESPLGLRAGEVDLAKTEKNVTPEDYILTCSEALKGVVADLLRGSIIAVPTDTIYGLAGLAQKDEAVRDIYRVKQRSILKPLAICVADVDDIYRWCAVTVPRALLEDLLPGPVTVILHRRPDLNPRFNPDLTNVGVRIPDHQLIRALAREAGTALALTSANISSHQSPLCIQEFRELWSSLAWVIDGGQLGAEESCRQGSTVVDLTVPGKYTVVREGGSFMTTVAILEAHGLEKADSAL